MSDDIKELALAGIEFAEFDKVTGIDKYLEETNKPVMPAKLFCKGLKKYFFEFDKHCFKSEHSIHFTKHFHVHLRNFIKTLNIDSLHPEYDEYKKLLNDVQTNEFWREDLTHPVFGTESNERFFNYVMGCYKDDVRCYKQKTLSYMYWVMMKVIHRPMYIRYVNEHYAIDLNPIEKIKGRPQIEGEEVVAQYTQVFNDAQRKWNDENPLYNKDFKGLFYVN